MKLQCPKCKLEQSFDTNLPLRIERDLFYFRQNGTHIECKCSRCDAHVKFIPKSTFDMLCIDLEKPQTAQALF